MAVRVRTQEPPPTPLMPPPRASGLRLGLTRGDVAAMLGLVALGLALFGPHILGLSTYVGNSDRLHTFLNVRELQVDAWQQLGRVPAWSDATLLGVPLYGLHWMAAGLDPVAALVALFPARDVFRVSGYVSAVHVIVAAIAAYLVLRDIVRSPFPAAVGAALYVCSAFAVHRISQVDPAFAVLIFQPLGLLILRRMRPGRAALGFLGLTGIVVALLGFTFLQEAAYMLIFFGMYVCYRLVVFRDWRSFVALGAAGIVGILLVAPRLGTVVEDIRETSRSATIQGSCPCELLRWFDDGIYGRYPQEAATFQNGINLHEGLQLYMSTFAAGAVLATLLRPRGIVAVLLGGVFLGTLVYVAKPLVTSPQLYDRLGLLAGALVAWGLCRPLVAKLFGMPRSFYVRDRDLWFFTLFVSLAFAIVLSDTVRYVIYVLFFRVDFSHSRISAAALLPLCALAAVFVRELFGEQPGAEPKPRARHAWALAAGAVIAVLVVLALDPLTGAGARALFGSVDRIRLGSWINLPTPELTRVLLVGAMFPALLWANWLARHVFVGRGPDGYRLSLRASERPSRMPVARLIPAYTLGCLMLVQAFGSAYFQINGSHTFTYPVAFLGNNNFSAPADTLRPPSPAARQALASRLETEAYRSVVVNARGGYPTYNAPSEKGYPAFLGVFWQLRLAQGYPILPRRVAELPWPDASRSLRSVYFTDQDALPWPLLALLNVKYAVVASPSLVFNVPPDPSPRIREARPEDLTILQNPLPVVPRAFFAESVTPRAVPMPPVLALPPPPTAIRATVLTDENVHVTWVGDVAEASYKVYRRQIAPTEEITSVMVRETPRGIANYYDPGLESGGTYEYRIQACDSRGCGALSAPIRATLARKTAVAPKLLAVEPRSATEALVTWTTSDPDATTIVETYTVGEAQVGVYAQVPPGEAHYVVGGLKPLRDYRMRVRACRPDGCSPHAAELPVSMPSSLTATDFGDLLPADPTRESLVDGLPSPLTFGSAAGAIRASYGGDRIRIEVDRSDAQRFLVVNELYHPGWHAYVDGNELKVWPTNIVMRGVLVPPGVTEIELRYEPFFTSWIARICVILGLAAGIVGWVVLRRLDAARQCSAEPAPMPARPVEQPELSPA